MGPLITAYRDMIDDAFHRGRFDRLGDYLTDDYAIVDVTRPERRGGVDGTRDHIERVQAGVRDLRYEILDAFESGDRMAVRYLVSGRAEDGRRLLATGLSFHHGRDGRLRKSWNIGDQRDLGVGCDAEPPAELVDRWSGPAIRGVGPLAARYALALDRLYGVQRPLGELMHPDYLPYDPFAARKGGIAATESFHAAVRERLVDVTYQVLDSFEVNDRLATRFTLRGLVDGEPATVLGLSVNQTREGRFHRAWIYSHYGRVTAAAEAAVAAAESAAS